jgi:hypothetical protein
MFRPPPVIEQAVLLPGILLDGVSAFFITILRPKSDLSAPTMGEVSEIFGRFYACEVKRLMTEFQAHNTDELGLCHR